MILNLESLTLKITPPPSQRFENNNSDILESLPAPEILLIIFFVIAGRTLFIIMAAEKLDYYVYQYVPKVKVSLAPMLTQIEQMKLLMLLI